MTASEATELLMAMESPSLFDIDADFDEVVGCVPCNNADARPEAIVAAIRLIGMLDESHDESDLAVAIRHFEIMLKSGEVGMEQWQNEFIDLVLEPVLSGGLLMAG